MDNETHDAIWGAWLSADELELILRQGDPEERARMWIKERGLDAEEGLRLILDQSRRGTLDGPWLSDLWAAWVTVVGEPCE